MIGICEDLGVDDYGKAETFTIADARTIERWATARVKVANVSFWNVQNDNSKGSQQQQSRVRVQPTSWSRSAAGRPSPQPPRPAVLARGVGPTIKAATCARCRVRRARSAWPWTSPATTRRPGTGCAGPRRSRSTPCGRGRADERFLAPARPSVWPSTRWAARSPGRVAGGQVRGRSIRTARGWSRCPVRARPSARRWTATGGSHLTWNGAAWSRPRRIDATGTAVQAISCASARFCAASDWGGHVLTWHGAAWSKPRLVDPTTDSTGGGISSLPPDRAVLRRRRLVRRFGHR